MSFPDDPIIEYAIQHSTAEDEVLANLSRETHLHTVYPNMLSGPLQGRLLEMISCLLRPLRILEIGTFTGYSGICLARGLANGGFLHTIDINDETSSIARRYFNLAGVAGNIVMHTGYALDIIPGLNEVFDLIFIDADKEQYVSYYQAAFPKLKTGGFMLADNVLWGGKVLQAIKHPDKETKGILDFNQYVSGDVRVDKVLIPLRDGLYLIRKLTN
jgi:predicted O-methyltransferase YrrM